MNLPPNALLTGLLLGGTLLLASGARADPLRPAEQALVGGDVVKIEVRRQQGGVSLGSGVVVAADRVVTNCHVTRDALAIDVLRRGMRYPIERQAVDARHDLCMLQAAGLGLPGIAIGRASRLRVGQPLTAVGYTGGMGLQGSDGAVVALHRMDGAPVIQSSNWFNSGASGGALLDDERRLVGILTFRMRGGGDGHYYAAPVEWLEPLLAPDADYRPVAPLARQARAYWQEPPDAQPVFLQAASLAQAQRWRELQALAGRWSQVSVRNPQPWFSLGLAAEALQHTSEAVVSFQRAVEIDPDFAAAWLHLGLLYAREGRRDKAREVLAILAPMNAAFAAQLGERL